MTVDDGTPNSQTPAPSPAPSPTPTPSSTPAPSDDDPLKPLIGGEPKPDGGEPEPFVPVTAEDIKFPDDFVVQDDFRDEFLTIANDQEMSHKDRTQALTDLYVKAAQAASEASSKVWEDTQKEWQDAVKADTEVGGDKLQPALAAINKLVSEYGSPELVEAFAMTGAGNNVHVIKFLNSIADKLTESGTHVSGAPTVAEADVASKMFPSMKGK